MLIRDTLSPRSSAQSRRPVTDTVTAVRVATHDGSFHADEVFALAALSLHEPVLEIVRTRHRDGLAAAEMRVDVGFRDDPLSGDFDHHQRDFDRVRANGVRFASFGLIWSRFGVELCDGDAEVAAAVDATLVQPVDAGDTGQRLAELTVEDVHPLSLNGVIGGLNARWDETPAAGEERVRFDAALDLARGILQREIASAASTQRAVTIVRGAVAAADDPRVVEMPVNAPWKRALVPIAPEALYVIYPKRQGFGLEAVPRELGSFELRRPLPANWGGLDGDALVRETGVDDAVFCHAKRFLAVAGSRKGIGRLAELALQASD
jgi:uncharacterized UPF0160 family protein